MLDKNRDIDILVEGHTDSIPIRTAVYRDYWDLSVARATNETPEGRASNSRTEIILSPKLEEIMQLLY